MRRRYAAKPAVDASVDASVTEAALEAMDADELRSLIRYIIPWLEESTHARLVNELVDRAARNRTEWVPKGPSEKVVDAIVAFARAAERVGEAEPGKVDGYLREGVNAFLGKDYRAAFRIFRALLIPIVNGDLYLGQHEMVDEVLGADVGTCAGQYVVSVYMTSKERNRGKAVLGAIDEMSGIGHFWEPLRELERVAVEPLPGFDEFLIQWRAVVAGRVSEVRNGDWDSDEDRWLREVVARMEGVDGLARVARSSKRAEDLSAWCSVLVEAKHWDAALAAYDEAVELVADTAYARGDFLDGSALAAQELGRDDLCLRLERAWRQAPSMIRLRRWLGSSETTQTLRQRATEALNASPKGAYRQRALLHVLLGNFEAAAKLFADAPGLGWSDREHPGHLLFPVFCSLLSGLTLPADAFRDLDELTWMSERDEPRLNTPEVSALLELADVTAPTDGSKTHAKVLGAMRLAAEKRIAGVTENKRRRYYGHAAQLVAACAALEGSGHSASWVAGIRAEYRRYPALQRELNAHLGGR